MKSPPPRRGETDFFVGSQKLASELLKGQMQILRLTTPKLKDVWGPVRSE